MSPLDKGALDLTEVNLNSFVRRIHQDIPLTHFMKWSVSIMDPLHLSAFAPLTPNINDKGTFFGGASSALMTISAWSLIKFQLEKLGLSNDVVIHKSSCQWLRPQKSGIFIDCTFGDRPNWQEIEAALLNQNKNIHLKVKCQARNDTDITCKMTASFVVLAKG